MFAVAIILSVICLLLYTVLKNGTKYWRKRNVPFQEPIPFIGNIINVALLRKSFSDVVSELYFKFCTPYFGIWYFNDPQLVIKSPDLIRNIFVKDFDYFQERHVSWNEDMDKFTANMLFCMGSSRWKQKRANISPIFSPCKLKYIHSHIRDTAKAMIEYIDQTNVDGLLDVKELSRKYTVEAIGVIIFGVNLNYFKTEKPIPNLYLGFSLLETIQFALYFSKSYLFKVFKPKFARFLAMLSVKQFALDILNKKQLLGNCKGFNLVDFLTNNQENASEDLISRISEFLIASYHSTSSAISLALYELALNKNMQNKLRQEINETFEKHGDISYNELIFMEYLDKIIHETLRKYPIASMIGRTCVRSYKLPSGALTIEQGVRILIPLSALHHDPKYFPEPDLFDPERFSKESIQERPTYCYLPFGEGPRKCIGEKMALLIIKLAVVYIIRNYEIDVCEATTVKVQTTLMNFFLDVDGNVSIRFKGIDSSKEQTILSQLQ